MHSVCVFCGSSRGIDRAYTEAARSLGRTLAEANVRLIFGGGHVGLMGVLSNAALEAGGEVIGVIPGFLVERELAHSGLNDLRIVGSMHERKALMSELSDGFITLPGATGTLEEFFEILTWAQLGEHEKPCGLLNVAGYYDPLLAVFDHMLDKGFLSQSNRALLLVESEPAKLLQRLDHYRPPETVKWIDRSET
ncbi:MAG: TIGR00730 family Rossman fold protein [Rubrobacteraceae bacterium]